MKIFIDIGHPAHVHYYKNFIRIMQNRGHSFFITARDRECVKVLLAHENIPSVSRGSGGGNLIQKLCYIPKAILLIFLHSLRFKPDVFLSHGSLYALSVAFLLRKPFIGTADTDSTKIHKYMIPFVSSLLTPSCFKYRYGHKHILFGSYMELMYLHPQYFQHKDELIKEYVPKNNKKNVLLRFVSWQAFHDYNMHGLSLDYIKKLIFKLDPYCNVFISSEKKLDSSLQKYQAMIPPYLMHEFMNCMDLFIGESATMGSESAILGVPAIYFDGKGRGYTDEQEKRYGLVHNFRTIDGLLEKALELASTDNLKMRYADRHKRLLQEKCDPTIFLVRFIENFHRSKREILEHPDIQDRFR
jgi:uncharacterized protein